MTITGGTWQSRTLTGLVWIVFVAWTPIVVAAAPGIPGSSPGQALPPATLAEPFASALPYASAAPGILPPTALAEPFASALPCASQGALVGEPFQYTVQPGNSLTRIGARFGIEPGVLARANGMKYDALLHPGQVLQIDNRHIIPERLEEGILINLPQRMLYYFQAGRLVAHYPVGMGRPDWPTPAGHFKVNDLQENKTWYVPKSIQEEMRREDKVVLTRVPPGPENPLGKHWIGLSIPGIGIHGTIAPQSIYHFQSHGCIRLHPDDIAALFPQVTNGQPGKIIYAPVLLARLADGRIFLEVHRDIYKKGIEPIKSVEDLAKTQGLSDMIDWRKVQDVIRLKEGLAREVGLRAPLKSAEAAMETDNAR